MPLIAPWHLGRKPLENAQLEDPSGVKAWVDQKLEETNVVIITAREINPRYMCSFGDRIADAI
jgi:hypothetical protein